MFLNTCSLFSFPRYDSTSSKPVAARIIDFQLLRYTAPAHDFICALYLNTTRAFRDEHFLDLASVYHSAFTAELARCKLDVDKLMEWSEFKSSLEHYRMLGLLTACAYYPSTLLPDDIASVVFGNPEKLNKFMTDDQSEWTCLGFETDAIFRARISEVIDELAEHVATLHN
jgi:Ecdysteroid kinase-like family